MKLAAELNKLLNEQINNELVSSYTYLAMAAWFEHTPYLGFAKWMFAQSQEENSHAMKFYQHIVDREGKVELATVEKPRHDFTSPLEVLEISLKQEEKVTAQINDIYEVAEKVRDHMSKNLLLWFLNEQMEEEKSVRDMRDRLQLAGNDPASLLVLDREAGERKAGGGEGRGKGRYE